MNRTTEEILQRMEEIKGNDLFGFQSQDMAMYLSWPEIKPFLKDEAVAKYESGEETWTPHDDPVKEIKDYMEFALEKAHDHRGLSAGRSIDHMTAWLWLHGDEELLERFESAPYGMYGVPQLKVVCEAFEIPTPDEDWFHNMSAGRKCRPGCNEGC